MKEPKLTYHIKSELLKNLLEYDHANIIKADLCGYSEQLKKGDEIRIIDKELGIDQISKVTLVDKFGNIKLTFIRDMK